MDSPGIALCVLWGLCGAGLAWHTAQIARQITYVTLADGRRQERRIPLIFRMLLPLAPNFMPFVRKPVFDSLRKSAGKNLVAAGFEGLVDAGEFIALKIILPLVIGPGVIIFVRGVVETGNNPLLARLEVYMDILAVAWLYMCPTLWLRRELERRHRGMRRALPFVLDLLTLSVEAGMDFMTALQRNIEKRAMDPLGEEFLRVIREIQIGKTRREALRDMAKRVDLVDIRTVVNALVQADELGVSIGSVLRIQADQSRQRRFERAEKLANEAPVKMLFPLLFFIFPSVFLILLGPVITRLVQQAGL